MKVAIYLRVATEAQLATAEQRRMLFDFVGKEGLEVHNTYSDVGSSFLARPGFDALMADADSCHFDAVLLSDPSRLSRNYLQLFTIIASLKSKGIQLMTPKGEVKCELPSIRG